MDNNISHEKWDHIIKTSPFSSPFQTKEFYDIINSVDEYNSHAVAIEDDEELRAFALVTIQKGRGISGFFSRRGIIYGGPLLSLDNPTANNLLLNELYSNFKREAIYFETRDFFDYHDFSGFFKKNGWEYSSYLNVKLGLQNKSREEILSAMKYNRKREIRISLESGATYKACEKLEELKEVYKLLHNLYKEVVKLPLPPFVFFFNAMNSSICKIFIVEHNNTIIGGSVCFFLPGKEIYTMYYCGDRNYHKKIYPTHLSILAAIEFALTQKIRTLDFMGAGKKEIDYGVRQYKLEFGGDLVEHGRFSKISQPFLYCLGKTGLKMYRRI